MTGKGVDKMSEIEKQMCSKLSQIRQILRETPGRLCSPYQQVQNGGSVNKQGPGHEVGIFSMEVMDPGWLKAALNSKYFNRWVNKSKYIISKDTKKKDSISESTFLIFLTDQFTWNFTSSSEKSQAFKEFGSKPHIVVIDDAEDSRDAKKNELLKDLIMNKIYIKDLFFFSKLEKECDFITYLNGDDRTDSMPIGKGVNMLSPLPATLNPNRPVSSHHAAHPAASTIKEGHDNNSHPVHTMGEELLVAISPTSSQDRFNNSSCPTQIADPLVSIQAMPTQGRQVNTVHSAQMMGPLVPIQAVPNQDRHVNSAPAAGMMWVDTLAPFPDTPNLNKAVSSSHAAHTMHTYENQYDGMFTPASTTKEGHGNNAHPAHTMGEELLVVTSPTSSLDGFNNSSCPTQIAGEDLLLSIPSIARQRRCAKTSSPANVMDPPVPASSTPKQHTSVCTTDPKDMIDVSYGNELKTNISPKQPPGKKHNIGIFSRSSDEDYSWLVELLTSEIFRNSVQDVKPCYISNNGFQRFIDDLSECTLGILYHTKNRGRVNITNVNDSLYDEELDCLEQMLGKDNVLVVIDDLEDSSDQEKTRILENQPSIKSLARDLLLISCTEKAEKMQLVRKLKSVIQLHHP